MAIERFLAMTGSEIRENSSLPPRLAWMACHFSLYGAGLTDLPRQLPVGSMLILDDRIAPNGHDPVLVAKQLEQVVKEQHCEAVLLDLQRPDDPQTVKIAEEAIHTLPCPVGVSEAYARQLDCPIFLPPIPPHILPEDWLSPWKGREIWLESALDGSQLTVTREGCRTAPLPFPEEQSPQHHDPKLHCHYHMDVTPDQIQATLYRTPEDLTDLLSEADQLGVRYAIGLFQELGSPHWDRR